MNIEKIKMHIASHSSIKLQYKQGGAGTANGSHQTESWYVCGYVKKILVQELFKFFL